ncbi:uncharacterized protein BDZ99DRAFT_574469 [Mytilinidion resinicola]|uniref:Diaminohydroxyphosphoribosylamino-pyrimidine deaminase n=1 Tax=Mytilinidion resinicola TaxID=574789 RepID=A0A6A6YA21_9PEZI|nr:uncharacterized protein BDZ99DRAFT_574469 [Mytilinidion resinicola]KAF2805550.1 hypothetical protein BDZ99DRAFT_574469 [Mytilinidion resinicola]
MNELLGALGDPVTDPEEESFLVFSQAIPSRSLGFINSKATLLELTVAGRDLSIHQSPALLSSNRKEGTTGAVVWSVTPLFAEWIASDNVLAKYGFFSSESIVLELGCGVSGIVALSLAPQVGKYVATDQDYVLKLLKQNLAENFTEKAIPLSKRKQGSKKAKSTSLKTDDTVSNIETLILDWELDSVATIPRFLGQTQAGGDQDGPIGVDVLIACDCIYNDALIEPFVNTCTQICHLRSTSKTQRPTVCVVAQQLRSSEVFESWLKAFHRSFDVWRVPDELLIDALKENSGFVIHAGLLREESKPI